MYLENRWADTGLHNIKSQNTVLFVTPSVANIYYAKRVDLRGMQDCVVDGCRSSSFSPLPHPINVKL
jgi:hypothetical protein